MENKLPKRKNNRLADFEYSASRSYFLTICTKDNQCILSKIKLVNAAPLPQDMPLDEVGALLRQQIIDKYSIELTDIGRIVFSAIENIPKIYPRIKIDHFIIMPNHIHMILRILPLSSGSAMHSPTDEINHYSIVQKAVSGFKGYVTKQIGRSIWQRSFYDHVIRNIYDYNETVIYINKNPIRWYKKYHI